jgi:hypothetical protein
MRVDQGMIFLKKRCGVPPSCLDQDVRPSRMKVQIRGDVVHPPPQHHPCIACICVLPYLRQCYVGPHAMATCVRRQSASWGSRRFCPGLPAGRLGSRDHTADSLHNGMPLVSQRSSSHPSHQVLGPNLSCMLTCRPVARLLATAERPAETMTGPYLCTALQPQMATLGRANPPLASPLPHICAIARTHLSCRSRTETGAANPPG